MIAADSAPTKTFSTTKLIKTHNTATVDPVVLATSNGHSGMNDNKLRSTSFGSVESGALSGVFLSVGSSMTMFVALCVGLGGILRSDMV